MINHSINQSASQRMGIFESLDDVRSIYEMSNFPLDGRKLARHWLITSLFSEPILDDVESQLGLLPVDVN